MSNYDKHLSLAIEKLEILAEAYKNHKSSVVGDMGIKVIEQLVEADVARNNLHYTKHYDRHQYMNKNYPVEINNASLKTCRAMHGLIQQ